MRNKLLVLITGILLVGTIIAGGLNLHDINIEVSKQTKDQLAKMNLTNIEKSACIKISEDYCEFKMYDKIYISGTDEYDFYNLGTHEIPLRYCSSFDADENCLIYIDYSVVQLGKLIEEKSAEWLEQFSDISIQRENRNVGDIKVGSGNVTVKEKK